MLNIHSEEWRERVAELVEMTGQTTTKERTQAFFEAMKAVAESRGVTTRQILQKRGPREVTEARMHAFYVLYLMGYSMAYIGDGFDTHHSTVWHGIKRYKERLGKATTNGVSSGATNED